MLPIRDDAPHATTPFITYFLIGLNIVVFLFELTLGTHARAGFFAQFGFVPYNVDAWLAGDAPADVALVPLLSSMFLHGSWAHLIFNMWFLAIFGDNVEDRLGHFGYLLFYLAAGVGGGLLHFAFNIQSSYPTLGASGAIAGVMGAYFLLFPSARVLTWFLFFVLWLPAWLVLGYWFVVQFLTGAASTITSTQETGRVAVWAHVGGFLTGILLVKMLPLRRNAYPLEN
jgi:membrane associated rhomboid family serine protease